MFSDDIKTQQKNNCQQHQGHQRQRVLKSMTFRLLKVTKCLLFVVYFFYDSDPFMPFMTLAISSWLSFTNNKYTGRRQSIIISFIFCHDFIVFFPQFFLVFYFFYQYFLFSFLFFLLVAFAFYTRYY